MFSLSESANVSGQAINLWGLGTLTYANVVIVANCTLLFATNTHSIWSLLITFLSIFSFFVVWYIENLFPFFDPLYKGFSHVMRIPFIYFLFFMAMAGLYPIDKLIHWGFLNPVDAVLRREAY